MLLSLDVGNSQIFGGVFSDIADNKLILRFRHETNATVTSDQLGTFLKGVLRENNLDHKNVKHIAISSVVPSIDYSLHAACKKYFNIDPFSLKAGIKTGIKIKTQNQAATGADLIAEAIAATHHYPKQNLIITDLGTITTIIAVTANKEFLGGAFIPGMRLAMLALSNNAAKLFPVEITMPQNATGRSTAEAIQSGLYHGHLGSIKEIISQISHEAFPNGEPILLGTGGFAHLFKNAEIFAAIKPDLILEGLRLAYIMNQ